MTTVKQVCRHVRSKNAGPFWVTFDLFFDGEQSFRRYSESGALSPSLMQHLFGADPRFVKKFVVPRLLMVKISCTRSSAQGGEIERDMHCGQQFVRLLDVDLDVPE